MRNPKRRPPGPPHAKPARELASPRVGPADVTSSAVFSTLQTDLVRASISPSYAKTYLSTPRTRQTGRSRSVPSDPHRRFVVADHFWTPYFVEVIQAAPELSPQMPQLVLELMQFALAPLGGEGECVSRCADGPSPFATAIHVRFRSPHLELFGAHAVTRRIVERVLVKLRVCDVPPLLADLRAANERRALRLSDSARVPSDDASKTLTISSVPSVPK